MSANEHRGSDPAVRSRFVMNLSVPGFVIGLIILLGAGALLAIGLVNSRYALWIPGAIVSAFMVGVLLPQIRIITVDRDSGRAFVRSLILPLFRFSYPVPDVRVSIDSLRSGISGKEVYTVRWSFTGDVFATSFMTRAFRPMSIKLLVTKDKERADALYNVLYAMLGSEARDT